MSKPKKTKKKQGKKKVAHTPKPPFWAQNQPFSGNKQGTTPKSQEFKHSFTPTVRKILP